MNDDPLSSLFIKAREAGPRDTSAQEYGFETRLMARLMPKESPFLYWTWRLAPYFAAITLAFATHTWHTQPDDTLALESELEESQLEWIYIAGVTGKAL